MTYFGFISCVVLLWFDVCWCYGVVRLEWCGILMQALNLLRAAYQVVVIYSTFHPFCHPGLRYQSSSRREYTLEFRSRYLNRANWLIFLMEAFFVR